MNKIFVYGTLKRGCGNHRYLEDCEFVGEAISCDSVYAMRGFHIPFLSEGGDQKVKGELWEVNDLVLEAIDRLEGHPTFYCREERWFELENGDRELAWVYLVEPETTDRLENQRSNLGPLYWERML